MSNATEKPELMYRYWWNSSSNISQYTKKKQKVTRQGENVRYLHVRRRHSAKVNVETVLAIRFQGFQEKTRKTVHFVGSSPPGKKRIKFSLVTPSDSRYRGTPSVTFESCVIALQQLHIQYIEIRYERRHWKTADTMVLRSFATQKESCDISAVCTVWEVKTI